MQIGEERMPLRLFTGRFSRTLPCSFFSKGNLGSLAKTL